MDNARVLKEKGEKEQIDKRQRLVLWVQWKEGTI